jgi:hypothetical protein
MSYKVTISGAVLEKCIEHVTFYVDTPDHYDMQTDPKNSMIITGKIDTDEGTAILYKWAVLPATNPDCYKEISVEYTKNNQLVRKVSFSKAFVVDYSESYSNFSGVGTFTLYVRQFRGKDIECVGQTSQPSTVESSITEEVKEQIEVAKEQIPVAEKVSASKSTMSITDRIAKQKEMMDNSSNGVIDSMSAIDKYVTGDKDFDNDVLQEYSNSYSKLVNSNEVWSWDEDIPNGENLTAAQRKKIKDNAVKSNLVKDVKIKKVEGQKFGYADFKGAGLVIDEIDLPQDLWLVDDDTQFKWLNSEIKKKNPNLFPIGYVGEKVPGTTWHHSEIPGNMQLVPTGIHNIYTHNGGRSTGNWACASRKKNTGKKRRGKSK